MTGPYQTMQQLIDQPEYQEAPTMTRRDFELIAETIAYRRAAVQILANDTVKGRAAESAALAELDQLTYAFAGNLAKTNPRFDRDRFIYAAAGTA